ncbi:uncharacterized protein LOC110695203 [Chenopodium quinoa]|uniref:uncharacterized protein LOC110695203 n=1 Tax=Chenopodium quinoa TaxID=63459 RepID=UPI000B77F4C1|nr:uncharacterized protein LOC110695203 [Chenopodium quinoa]
MAEYETQNNQEPTIIPKETAIQTLNTIIQLHFEKTLEKKRAVDHQKKQLWKLFQHFFLFLSLVFASLSLSTRLQCRHSWIPISLLSFSHLIFYVSVAQTLRCINAFKYQRRCHKLTLGLATDKLRQLKTITMINSDGGNHASFGVINNVDDESCFVNGQDFEIHYQEPPESYFGKFKRNWALYFGFLILVYGFMVSSSVVLLCF